MKSEVDFWTQLIISPARFVTSKQTQSSLLIRIRDTGDTESWNVFVQVYTPIVYRFLIGKGLQDADAADVTQDVLIEVARCIRSFEYRPENGRFRDWLAVVTKRRLFKFWKSVKFETRLDQIESESNSGDDAEWIDVYQTELLRVALSRVETQVEPATWTVFRKTWLENVPSLQVSQELKLSIDLVYSSKSRVLKRLEAEIRRLGDDCGWIESS